MMNKKLALIATLLILLCAIVIALGLNAINNLQPTVVNGSTNTLTLYVGEYYRSSAAFDFDCYVYAGMFDKVSLNVDGTMYYYRETAYGADGMELVVRSNSKIYMFDNIWTVNEITPDYITFIKKGE